MGPKSLRSIWTLVGHSSSSRYAWNRVVVNEARRNIKGSNSKTQPLPHRQTCACRLILEQIRDSTNQEIESPAKDISEKEVSGVSRVAVNKVLRVSLNHRSKVLEMLVMP